MICTNPAPRRSPRECDLKGSFSRCVGGEANRSFYLDNPLQAVRPVTAIAYVLARFGGRQKTMLLATAQSQPRWRATHAKWGQAGWSIAVRVESQKVVHAPATHWHRGNSDADPARHHHILCHPGRIRDFPSPNPSLCRASPQSVAKRSPLTFNAGQAVRYSLHPPAQLKK